jgi:hypothetical protein
MGAKVHPGAIPPAEEGLSLVDLPGDEFLGGGHGFLVDRFHPLPRERPGVLNGLATVAIRLGPKHTLRAKLSSRTRDPSNNPGSRAPLRRSNGRVFRH